MSKAFTREDDIDSAEVVRRPVTPSAVHLTPEGVERFRTELRELEQRAAAAEPQSQHRIMELRQLLAAAIVVGKPANKDVVRFGSSVTVRSRSDGEESAYRIVGPAEVDPSQGWISSVSPLARALLNRRVGESVTFRSPAGEDVLDILTVS